MIIRKIAAAVGLANRTRSGCSSANPITPVGIDAATISHASFSVGVSIRRRQRLTKNARMIAIQSRQK